MLITLLIFLILSNSLTLRRDKSILYSRATITIFLISAFIAYDNLFFLFLNKGIGIFGGLYISTTNVFHIFIFLISGVILLLTSFYSRKSWLTDTRLLDKLSATTTLSGVNSITIKLASALIITVYHDFDYNSMLSLYQDITYGLSYVTDAIPQFTKVNYSYNLLNDYYNSLSYVLDTKFTIVRTTINTHVSTLSFYSFSPLSFATSLSQFHYNLAMTHSTLKFITFFLGSLVLVIGVNIHNIIEMIVKLINVFINFVHYLIKSCSRYYDPVRDCIPDKQNYAETDRSNNSYSAANTVNNNKTTSANNGSNGDGDDEKNYDRKPILDKIGPEIDLAQLLLVLEYIRVEIINWRQSFFMGNTYPSAIEREWFGTPNSTVGDRVSLNRTVTIQQITRWAIAHHDRLTDKNVLIGSVLSPVARSILNGKWTIRSALIRRIRGKTLTNSLLFSEELRDLLQGAININGATLLTLWNRLFNKRPS